MNYNNLVSKAFLVVESLLFAIGYLVGLNEFLNEYPLSYSLFPFVSYLIFSLLFAATGIFVIKIYFRLNKDKNIMKIHLKICLVISLILLISYIGYVLELENLFVISSPLCITVVLCTLIEYSSLTDKNN